MILIGEKEPDAVAVNVAVISRLSSKPLMGTVIETSKSNIYLLSGT